jgi:hypothetical protein
MISKTDSTPHTYPKEHIRVKVYKAASLFFRRFTRVRYVKSRLAGYADGASE